MTERSNARMQCFAQRSSCGQFRMVTWYTSIIATRFCFALTHDLLGIEFIYKTWHYRCHLAAWTCPSSSRRPSPSWAWWLARPRCWAWPSPHWWGPGPGSGDIMVTLLVHLSFSPDSIEKLALILLLVNKWKIKQYARYLGVIRTIILA